MPGQQLISWRSWNWCNITTLGWRSHWEQRM